MSEDSKDMKRSIQLLEDDALSEERNGKNYLFVIGIDQYKECPTLFNAVKDAKAFRKILIEKYQFEEVNTLSLFDQEATQENILKSFSSLVEKINPEDDLVIYFSGHGEFEQAINEGYWIPVEGQISNTGTYISNSRITKYLKAIKSHHTFLVVDSCFSGSLFTERKLANKERLETLPSRWLLTSGRNEVVSDGKPGDHSPFADSILTFLEKHTDSSISVTQLINTVIESTIFNADQTPRGEPLKDVGHKGGQFFFQEKGSLATPLKKGDVNEEEKTLVKSVEQTGKLFPKWILIPLILMAIISTSLLLYTPKKETSHITHGFHPHWMGEVYEDYNYETWDRISFYDYMIDPMTGEARNPEVIIGLEESEIIKLAHEANSKVLITITSHQRKENEIFLLNDNNQQEVLINRILNLLERTDMDGITINFENIPESYGDEFTAFIKKLYNQLKLSSGLQTTFREALAEENKLIKEKKNYLLQIQLSSGKERDVYQITELNALTDLFLLPPSDSKKSSIDGSETSLSTSNPYSIESNVNYYVEKGLDPQKLLLGLTFYGTKWLSKTPELGSPAQFDRHVTYRQVISTKMAAIDESKILYDEKSVSAYWVNEIEDSIYPYVKYWFDDSLTVSAKYQWAIEQSLAGVSAWALGYDNSNPALEKAVGIKKKNLTLTPRTTILWFSLLVLSLMGILLYFFFQKRITLALHKAYS